MCNTINLTVVSKKPKKQWNTAIVRRIALLSPVIVSSDFPSSAVLFAHWPISPPLLLSTASSPSKVSRQWATSKVQLLWTFFLESRRTLIAGWGAQKRMLPKSRCERKLGQNKMGEWLRPKERTRKQRCPAVTQARYLGCVECEIFTWIGFEVCLKKNLPLSLSFILFVSMLGKTGRGKGRGRDNRLNLDVSFPEKRPDSSREKQWV